MFRDQVRSPEIACDSAALHLCGHISAVKQAARPFAIDAFAGPDALRVVGVSGRHVPGGAAYLLAEGVIRIAGLAHPIRRIGMSLFHVAD